MDDKGNKLFSNKEYGREANKILFIFQSNCNDFSILKSISNNVFFGKLLPNIFDGPDSQLRKIYCCCLYLKYANLPCKTINFYFK